MNLSFQIAILVVGGVLGGIGLGYLLDGWLSVFPLLTVAGSIGGMILAIIGVYYLVNKE